MWSQHPLGHLRTPDPHLPLNKTSAQCTENSLRAPAWCSLQPLRRVQAPYVPRTLLATALPAAVAAIFIHQLHFQPSGPGTEEAQHRIARGHGNGKLELVVQETAGWAGWKRWNCEEEAGWPWAMEHVIHEHGAEAGRPEIFGDTMRPPSFLTYWQHRRNSSKYLHGTVYWRWRNSSSTTWFVSLENVVIFYPRELMYDSQPLIPCKQKHTYHDIDMFRYISGLYTTIIINHRTHKHWQVIIYLV